MTKIKLYGCFLFLLVINSIVFSQEKIVPSFQNFFRNGEITTAPSYNLSYDLILNNSEGFQALNFSFIFPILRHIEFGSRFGYDYVSVTESGFSDLTLTFECGTSFGAVNPSIGAYFIFDIGSKIINDGGDSKGIFIAANFKIDDKLRLNVNF